MLVTTYTTMMVIDMNMVRKYNAGDNIYYYDGN